jgi:hypothetical protein
MRCRVALFLLAGVLTAQTTKPDPTGAIRGVVKDTTGAPMAGVAVTANTPFARVVIAPNGTAIMITQPPPSSRTDETGRYSLTGLTPGSYSVMPECAPGSKRIKLDADQETTVDFACPTNPTISGHVQDHNGDPAVDAFVWLLKSEYQYGVLKQFVIGPKVTGEDGAYSFDTGLEPNRGYYVVVDRDVPDEVVTAAAADLNARDPIEVLTYYPSATRMDAATPVILQPGENREQVNIKIVTAGFYCIDGKISASGSQASVSFAVQDLVLVGTRLVRLRSGSGEDGKYHVCGLPAGSYRLFTEDAFAEFTLDSSDVQHIDVAADAARLRLRVDWEDPPAPKFDDTGEAVLRKFASLLGMGDSPSDDDLNRLALRFKENPASPEINDLAVRTFQSHEFTDEQVVAFFRQLWARPNAVGVTLAGKTNGWSESLAVPVPADVPFQTGIPAGDYIVQVRTFGSSFGYVKELMYNGARLTDETLRVAPGDNGTVRVVMARDLATIAAHVTDTDGKPVPNATVIVVPDSVTSVALLSRTSVHGETDQSGDYTSSLTPGKYRVLATTQPVRWGIPDDLEKVLLVLFQAKDVDLDGKATMQVALPSVPIY